MMSADLFISYAWTSQAHRNWVRLLASQLHVIGYDVKIDEDVDYGSSLHGFMRQVAEARHVLLIVDENYVQRADSNPRSGVGIETGWMREVFFSKPDNWLSVAFIQNPQCKYPGWLENHSPKSFDFNSSPETKEFPGSLQLEELWRWVEGLPTSKRNAISISALRQRSARLERIDELRDPGLYANPKLTGQIKFCYRDFDNYTVGHGEYEFKIQFTGRAKDSVYVYTDGGLKAVGLIADPDFNPLKAASFLRPGRVVEPFVGQSVALLNSFGVMCVIRIDEVQPLGNAKEYIPEHVIFTYEVLVDEEVY